jgi:hypothetical protein
LKGKRTNVLDGGTTVPPNALSDYSSVIQIQLSAASVTEENSDTSAENALENALPASTADADCRKFAAFTRDFAEFAM